MQPIDSILTVVDRYDTIVFDQWGVLHNGTTPYPHAVATIQTLMGSGKQLCVLSNSGKRSGINRERITAMGFPSAAFDIVMTSGEALSIDIKNNILGDIRNVFPMTAAAGDAERWATGLPLTFTDDLAQADAILLMGLSDGDEHAKERAILNEALSLGKRLICSNPDRASPRANGVTVESPGALAHAHADAGGDVVFYGKPHRAIFDVLFNNLKSQNPARVLMVGDSPEHDIAGAHGAGWHSLFIAGGLHADTSDTDFPGDIRPTYTLSTLR